MRNHNGWMIKRIAHSSQVLLGPGGKRDLSGQTEANAEHELIGGNIPDLLKGSLPLLLSVALLQRDTNLVFYPLQHTPDRSVAVGLGREAVDVHHGEAGLRVWGEECLVAVV